MRPSRCSHVTAVLQKNYKSSMIKKCTCQYCHTLTKGRTKAEIVKDICGRLSSLRTHMGNQLEKNGKEIIVLLSKKNVSIANLGCLQLQSPVAHQNVEAQADIIVSPLKTLKRLKTVEQTKNRLVSSCFFTSHSHSPGIHHLAVPSPGVSVRTLVSPSQTLKRW